MSAIRSHHGISPKLGERVYVDPAATVIGDVELGDDCSVWPNAVIRGDMHRIRIGKRCSIQDCSVLHITHASDFNPGGWPLVLGDRVTVGHRVVLHGCTIASNVLVGNGAIIMDGVEVGENVIIGAGTMVPPGKKLEGGYLYVGSPAKQARPLTEREYQFFVYTSDNYVKLKDSYLAEQG